jgi:hypothetical protein
VHHDVWDYDLPAQPTLARIDTGAGMREVVIQPTKQGLVFVLDRETGQPIWENRCPLFRIMLWRSPARRSIHRGDGMVTKP